MRLSTFLGIVFSCLLIAKSALAQAHLQTDADYLTQRVTSLSKLIDTAEKDHRISQMESKRLHLKVEKVGVFAGNYQAHERPIPRSDADRMNQSLTDVERRITQQ